MSDTTFVNTVTLSDEDWFNDVNRLHYTIFGDPADAAAAAAALGINLEIPKAAAGGTVNAITADFTPDVTLTDKTIVFVVSAGANTSTTPTFAPDGLTAHTITARGGVALTAGDIGPAGFVAILEYNLANTRWELLNPVSSPSGQGIPRAAAGGTVDAITATYSPAVTLTDKTIVAVVSAGENTTTSPTFAPNGLTAHFISKRGGENVAKKDIGAAGFVALLEYNPTLSITGTVTTNGTTALVGTSTLFTRETFIGDVITVGGDTLTVDTITDDTNLATTAAFTSSASGQTLTRAHWELLNPTYTKMSCFVIRTYPTTSPTGDSTTLISIDNLPTGVTAYPSAAWTTSISGTQTTTGLLYRGNVSGTATAHARGINNIMYVGGSITYDAFAGSAYNNGTGEVGGLIWGSDLNGGGNSYGSDIINNIPATRTDTAGANTLGGQCTTFGFQAQLQRHVEATTGLDYGVNITSNGTYQGHGNAYTGTNYDTGVYLQGSATENMNTYIKLIGGSQATVTVPVASPGVVNWIAHGLVANDMVRFSTTGTLPTGINATAVYYVISTGLTADAFEVSATGGGAAINFTVSESGVHTAYHPIDLKAINFLPGGNGLYNVWLASRNSGLLVTGADSATTPNAYGPSTTMGTDTAELLVNGKIGVGTFTPGTALELSAATDIRARLTNTTATYGRKWDISSSDNGLFMVRDYTGSDEIKLSIDSAGKVGIGTGATAPGALLDVGLAGTTLGVMRMAGSTSGNVIIQPKAIAGTWTLTLPDNDGASGDVLHTDGSGVTSWSAGTSQWTTTGSDIYYNSGNVMIGTGTLAPNSKLTVSANTSAIPTPTANTVMNWANANSTTTRLLVDCFGGGSTTSQFTFRSANGTAASPSATQSGDVIGQLTAIGYGATAYATTSRAFIRFAATQAWTDSAHGTDVELWVTANGSTTPSRKLHLDQDGTIVLNAYAGGGTRTLKVDNNGLVSAV